MGSLTCAMSDVMQSQFSFMKVTDNMTFCERNIPRTNIPFTVRSIYRPAKFWRKFLDCTCVTRTYSPKFHRDWWRKNITYWWHVLLSAVPVLDELITTCTHLYSYRLVFLRIKLICTMFSIRNFFSMVVLLAVSARIVNAFKSTSSRWMRTSAVSMNADAVPVTGDRINKIIDLESPKVVSAIALNAGEKCVVCRCWKRFVVKTCTTQKIRIFSTNIG